MEIQELLELYARSAQSAALMKTLEDVSVKNVFLQGLVASSAPMFFASLVKRNTSDSFPVALYVLQDAEEAGYFYHDLVQLLGTEDVLFFPSSYRRQVKYGQRDAANEILRTEVLSRLSSLNPSSSDSIPNKDRTFIRDNAKKAIQIVTYPDALAELVVSKKKLDERSVRLEVGAIQDISELEKHLRELGFTEVDYVYEPGQFAARGSIVDVFSYSSEYPFRLDFFGDEIDSIRTFEVQSQLSRDKRETVEIVPELATLGSEKVSFMKFLPADTLLVMIR